MATNVIMPALEMAQESGVLVSWLKRDGESVTKGEPIMEIETDKVTVEIEAPASGVLGGLLAREGDVVPVGQTIGWILAPGETPPAAPATSAPSGRARSSAGQETASRAGALEATAAADASPLARNVAQEHGVDLAQVRPVGKRIEKSDVLAYMREHESPVMPQQRQAHENGRIPASAKARRLAAESGIDLATLTGSGPEGAVLTTDVEAAREINAPSRVEQNSQIWRVMAEHMTASWTSVPHFYLVREVDATNLVEWRSSIVPAVEKRTGVKVTYTDLLVKLIGVALRGHPRMNASWAEDGIRWNQEINVGIATAVADGLIVPVIHRADSASIGEIAVMRRDLVTRAQARKLRPADIAAGTFTLTNLGMYNVDAFGAIVNTPQAGILAVGRIVERVVPLKGEIVIRPMMIFGLSCDHRVVDGARAAQFLDELANLVEAPLGLLN
ncbi:MAG: 2-oxo acid dehydrogenase subunit E2 [Anaerolineales bacterium]